ncbi:MAG: YggT family protein, partial [Psychromonas sp.]
MNAVNFLVNTLFDLYLMVVLLRVWLQVARADFYNPFSQFVIKATQPVVAPLRRMIPSLGGWDLATIVFAFAVACLKIIALSLIVGSSMNPIVILIS